MTGEGELVQRWRDLLGSYSKVSCVLDKTLHEAHGIGMSEFEALDRMVDAGIGQKLKMHELAADMYLSQSALSRTVARLERAGYVERTMCTEDRRAIFVKLTDEGRTIHAQACKIQRAVLARHLASEPVNV